MTSKRARPPDGADDPLAACARRLRDARMAAGFATTCAAAEVFGWNRNTYASNENGNAAFSYRRAGEYAKAFGVRAAWLYDGTGEMTPRAVAIAGRGRKAVEIEIRAQALAHSAEALAALVKVATEGGSDAAKVSAANAILDRAHGKARQPSETAAKSKSRVRRIERVVIDPANPDAEGVHAPAGPGPVQGRVRGQG